MPAMLFPARTGEHRARGRSYNTLEFLSPIHTASQNG